MNEANMNAAATNMESDDNDFPDHQNLDLSFDDLAGEQRGGDATTATTTTTTTGSNSPRKHKMTGTFEKQKDKTALGNNNEETDDEADYILGTLIVRVVAARDLPAVNSGLGKLLFGKHKRPHEKGGTANPYASVRFGDTVQRTSQVFQTTDPLWPRHETIYMDVTHPPFRDHTTTTSTQTTVKLGSSSALKAQSSSSDTNKEETQELRKPLLTIACFHSDGGKKYNPSKQTGDSDDIFLGMASADMTTLITGKIRTFDQWLPLSGIGNPRDEKHQQYRAAVRIVCEYEVSDPPPEPGDLVRFTHFCRPADLYPAVRDRLYILEERENDDVWITWTSPEGWVSSYRCHRYMLFCEERHQGPVGYYQEELASITDRLSHSPLVHSICDSVQRLPDDGLVSIGQDLLKGGLSLFSRWKEGGVDQAIGDLVYATNWDGHLNPTLDTSDSLDPIEEEPEEIDEERKPPANDSPYDDKELPEIEPLPNMPSCPITGEPMRDPVVAADGHTYERSAIARWLRSSDKSPLTGSVLDHKNLVPNYMLLSSLQEATTGLSSVIGNIPAVASLPTPSSTADLIEEDLH